METKNAYADLVYGLGQTAAIESLQNNNAMLQAANAEWNKDSGSFEFAAKRHGDFLTVFISRGGEKYAGALNLGLASEIKLVEGHAPDLKGALGFDVYQTDEKGSGSCGEYFDASHPPSKGYHYTVSALMPSVPTERQMIYIIPQKAEQARSSVYYCREDWDDVVGNYRDGPKIEGIFRPAKDDTIELYGVATIYAPAGKGAEVRDAILAEIARGFEPQQGPRS